MLLITLQIDIDCYVSNMLEIWNMILLICYVPNMLAYVGQIDIKIIENWEFNASAFFSSVSICNGPVSLIQLSSIISSDEW